jgi:hypothetical protein
MRKTRLATSSGKHPGQIIVPRLSGDCTAGAKRLRVSAGQTHLNFVPLAIFAMIFTRAVVIGESRGIYAPENSQ